MKTLQPIAKYEIYTTGEVQINMGPTVNNYGTVQGSINNAGRDINYGSHNTNGVDIAALLKSLNELKSLIEKENIDTDDKDCVVASIEAIESEVKTENPRKGWIKNAWKTIVNFCSKAPAVLAEGTKIKDAIEKSKPYLEELVGETIDKIDFPLI